MGCSPPGSSVHGILQTRILEWIAMPFSRGSSWPRSRNWVSHTAGRPFTRSWVNKEWEMPKVPSVCRTVFICLAVPLSIPFQHVLCPTWLIFLEWIKWALVPLKFWLSSFRGKHQQGRWRQKSKHDSIRSCSYFSKYFSYDPWSITHQASLSIEFSRQEYWSG